MQSNEERFIGKATALCAIIHNPNNPKEIYGHLGRVLETMKSKYNGNRDMFTMIISGQSMPELYDLSNVSYSANGIKENFSTEADSEAEDMLFRFTMQRDPDVVVISTDYLSWEKHALKMSLSGHFVILLLPADKPLSKISESLVSKFGESKELEIGILDLTWDPRQWVDAREICGTESQTPSKTSSESISKMIEESYNRDQDKPELKAFFHSLRQARKYGFPITLSPSRRTEQEEIYHSARYILSLIPTWPEEDIPSFEKFSFNNSSILYRDAKKLVELARLGTKEVKDAIDA